VSWGLNSWSNALLCIYSNISITLSEFFSLFFCFSDRVSFFPQSYHWATILLTSFPMADFIDMTQHTWLVCWDKVLLTFCLGWPWTAELTSDSQVDWITRMHHQALLYFLIEQFSWQENCFCCHTVSIILIYFLSLFNVILRQL
jgi:hypothetical protein